MNQVGNIINLGQQKRSQSGLNSCGKPAIDRGGGGVVADGGNSSLNCVKQWRNGWVGGRIGRIRKTTRDRRFGGEVGHGEYDSGCR